MASSYSIPSAGTRRMTAVRSSFAKERLQGKTSIRATGSGAIQPKSKRVTLPNLDHRVVMPKSSLAVARGSVRVISNPLHWFGFGCAFSHSALLTFSLVDERQKSVRDLPGRHVDGVAPDGLSLAVFLPSEQTQNRWLLTQTPNLFTASPPAVLHSAQASSTRPAPCRA